VIVLVLVTLLLAAFLLTAFIRRTGTELLADARAAERRQLRAEAYSALETVLAVVAAQQKADGALHGPDEAWVEAMAAAGYEPQNGREIEVSFEDESAKIPLGNTDQTTLQTALGEAGLNAGDAERMALTLMAWMQAGDDAAALDADAPDYTANDPAYRPARRTPRSWGELTAAEFDREVFFDADGVATQVLQRFQQDFSLHAFALTNVNTAPASVLVALGLGTGEIGALENHRRQERRENDLGYFRSLTEATTVMGPSVSPERFSTNLEALRVNLTVRQGAIAFRLTVVVAAPGTGEAAVEPRTEGAPPPTERKRLDYPFAVLEIGEDQPLPEPTSSAL